MVKKVGVAKVGICEHHPRLHECSFGGNAGSASECQGGREGGRAEMYWAYAAHYKD